MSGSADLIICVNWFTRPVPPTNILYESILVIRFVLSVSICITEYLLSVYQTEIRLQKVQTKTGACGYPFALIDNHKRLTIGPDILFPGHTFQQICWQLINKQ